jgi:hypothetical protein
MHMQHGSLVVSKLKGGKEVYDAQRHFAFHRVSNFKAYTWSAEDRRFHWKLTYPGQYDIAKYTGSVPALCASLLSVRVRTHAHLCAPVAFKARPQTSGLRE